MVFVFREVFLMHSNLVTQKISYFEIIYQYANHAHFFIYEEEFVLIFFNIQLIFLVQTSFSSMLVENNINLNIAKMLLTYTTITEKSLWRLTFWSFVLHVYIFYFLGFLILEDKIKYFFVVWRSKSMFCEHYFLSQLKNIGSIKR